MADARRFSILDAGRLAASVAPVHRSPARDEILIGAARLWCRDLSPPTVRAIGIAVGRSPVTVLAPFGSMRHLYAHVIREEWSLLDRRWYRASPGDAWDFLGDHVAQLSSVDRTLLRLPALVHAAISSSPTAAPPADVNSRTAVLYLVAAHATSSAPVDTLLADMRRVECDLLAAA